MDVRDCIMEYKVPEQQINNFITLYLSDFPHGTTTTNDIYSLLSKVFEVINVYIPSPTPTGIIRNFAMIKIKKKDNINKYIHALNHSLWKGKKIKLEISNKEFYLDKLNREIFLIDNASNSENFMNNGSVACKSLLVNSLEGTETATAKVMEESSYAGSYNISKALPLFSSRSIGMKLPKPNHHRRITISTHPITSIQQNTNSDNNNSSNSVSTISNNSNSNRIDYTRRLPKRKKSDCYDDDEIYSACRKIIFLDSYNDNDMNTVKQSISSSSNSSSSDKLNADELSFKTSTFSATKSSSNSSLGCISNYNSYLLIEAVTYNEMNKEKIQKRHDEEIKKKEQQQQQQQENEKKKLLTEKEAKASATLSKSANSATTAAAAEYKGGGMRKGFGTLSSAISSLPPSLPMSTNSMVTNDLPSSSSSSSSSLSALIPSDWLVEGISSENQDEPCISANDLESHILEQERQRSRALLQAIMSSSGSSTDVKKQPLIPLKDKPVKEKAITKSKDSNNTSSTSSTATNSNTNTTTTVKSVSMTGSVSTENMSDKNVEVSKDSLTSSSSSSSSSSISPQPFVNMSMLKEIYYKEGGVWWGSDDKPKGAEVRGSDTQALAAAQDEIFREAEKLGIDIRPASNSSSSNSSNGAGVSGNNSTINSTDLPFNDIGTNTSSSSMMFGFFDTPDTTSAATATVIGTDSASDAYPDVNHNTENISNSSLYDSSSNNRQRRNDQEEEGEENRYQDESAVYSMSLTQVIAAATRFRRDKNKSIEELTLEWREWRDKMTLDYKRKRREARKWESKRTAALTSQYSSARSTGTSNLKYNKSYSNSDKHGSSSSSSSNSSSSRHHSSGNENGRRGKPIPNDSNNTATSSNAASSSSFKIRRHTHTTKGSSGGRNMGSGRGSDGKK